MCGGPGPYVLCSPKEGIDGPDSREVVIERSARLHLSPWSGSAGGPDSPAAARRVADIPPPALPGGLSSLPYPTFSSTPFPAAR